MKCKLLYNSLTSIVLVLFVIWNSFSFDKYDKSRRRYSDLEIQKDFDTVKKNKRYKKGLRLGAVLSVPIVSAGSSCGDGVNFVQVNLSAFAVNTAETVEWFTTQNSSTPVFTGNNFSPSIRSTRTYYVRSRLGSDFSTRVPVVASVFIVPPSVTLSSFPVVDPMKPLCIGETVMFTANGGADLFEFSVDGNIVQQMSSSRTFITNTLTDGQVVMVRSRFSSVIDGVSNERAFGTGPLEDNGLSAPLSSSAVNAYVNAVKVASEEDNIIFAVPSKITNNNSLLLFLDTKPGGFNMTNFADVLDGSGAVKAFNFLNDNGNTFDSYFQADYCLVLFADSSSGTYSANLVELKSDISLLTFIGNASSGNPSSAFAVNPNSSGISDISNGFEVVLKKAALGYTTGDLKFFAFTVVTDGNDLQSITNSFLSPEQSSALDYGGNAVDFNQRDPNPVVVASAALTPCYSDASIEMNFVTKPIAFNVVQPTCAIPNGKITFATQEDVEYSLDGINFQNSPIFDNLSAATYTLYTRSTTNSSCITSADSQVTINNAPTPPALPTVASVVQPTCAVPTGSITVNAQNGVEYSLNGTNYQASNVFSGLAPNTYTLYVRSTTDNTCITSSTQTVTINNAPTPPAVPTAVSVVQPTCAVPTGSITVSTQNGVEYSLNGTNYQASNVFSGLAPNTYTLYVRSTTDNTCITSSTQTVTINNAPTPPAVPTVATVVQPTCAVPTGSITVSTQNGVEYSLNGTNYQASNVFSGLAPNTYTLYVRSTTDNTCITSSTQTVTINNAPTPPAVPTAAIVVQPTCAVPSGSITVSTQNGVEYSLNGTNYQASNVFSGLAPNTYTLYVRSTTDNTCITSSTQTVTINNAPTPPAVPTAVSVVQPTCAVPTGSITVSTQNGVEYSLNGTNYQASNVFSGLAPNTYTLYVRSTTDNTCITSSTQTVTINNAPTPPAVPTAASVVQPTCAVPTGSITVSTQNGVEYSLNGTNYQASNVFSGLAPNTYTLYVRSTTDNTCITSSTQTVTINNAPTPPAVPTAVSVVQPTCAVPTGSITVSTQNGVEYSLNGTNYQASNVFSGLAPNTYTLYVRSTTDNTCITSSTQTVTINNAPTPPAVPTAASVVQPTCAVPSGSITVSTQNGVEYSLNGTNYQASNVFSGLAPNTYTLYVRSTTDNTCITSSTQTVTINNAPTPPAVPTAVSVVQPTCAVPTGSITVNAQNGVEYSLNGTNYQASNVFSGLAPNTYTLYVRSTTDNTCITSSTQTVTINNAPTPPAVPTAVSVVQPTCAVPTGSITVSTQNGVEYSLNGTNYQASNVFSGLAPNTYTLYVRSTTDNTCITSSTQTVTINNAPTPPAVPTAASVVQPTCAVPTGSITVSTQNGVEYSLNGTNYQASNVFSGLAPNTYTLYVRSTTDNTCITSSTQTVTINNAPTPPAVPTAVSVVQPTCAVPTGSITVSTQNGVEYSLNGTNYQASNVFSGLAPNTYTLYIRSTTDNTCITSSTQTVTINNAPTPPAVPTAASVVQPTCAVPTGSITVSTQNAVEYSLNGTNYQASNVFSGLAPNTYTLYVRSTTDNTCITSSTQTVTIDALPQLPTNPTATTIVQPTCAVPTGSITISAQQNVQYSIGNGYQNSPVFANLVPGNYTITVRFTNSPACIATGGIITINAIPQQIQFETESNCVNNEFVLTAIPRSSSYDPAQVTYQWKDPNGIVVGTSSSLNLSQVASNSNSIVFPAVFSLSIRSAATGCETTQTFTVTSIFCNIQKGISPDGNGSNDSFDLTFMKVKKLEVFNRYGIKVYSQSNYTNQWTGQSNSGEALPSATYYYVIEFESGTPKTGWIYLIREK